MNLRQRIDTFSFLGNEISLLLSKKGEYHKNSFHQIIDKAVANNHWFTPESITISLQNICRFLDKGLLKQWTSRYPVFQQFSDKSIAVIMAGNIPLVGFHDMLCVLISGYKLICKLSSKDNILPAYILDKILDISPKFHRQIIIAEDQLPKNYNAVIATGSNNSARFFKSYFNHVPHIIRKNRTSIAILDGTETIDELQNLGKDIFTYYGLGCRNISKIYIPGNFYINEIIDTWKDFKYLVDNHKYANNYEYNNVLMLMNNTTHFNTGFLILKEDTSLFSPIGVLHYETYRNLNEVMVDIKKVETHIQCIVGKNQEIAFGQSHTPMLTDYADRIDTMEFLTAFEKNTS